MKPPTAYPTWKSRTVRARVLGLESLSDHTEMHVDPSDVPSPKNTAEATATVMRCNGVRQHSAIPMTAAPNTSTVPRTVPKRSNAMPAPSLDAVRQMPNSDSIAAAKPSS